MYLDDTILSGVAVLTCNSINLLFDFRLLIKFTASSPSLCLQLDKCLIVYVNDAKKNLNN